ncbi:hypothetical protein DL768_005476 [Monosporascus sp. mg162]|nr:hypothetical protein DL768_005476 [Monosporascus sp. mg162]
MAQQIFSVTSYYGFAAVITGVFALLYFVYHNAYPKPLPGIPYNTQATVKFAGDLPEIQERQKDGASIRPWFLEQAHRHGSAITQIFLGPFARPAILISDFREVNDILMYREADFKRGKKVDVFSGILPHAHPAMETFDPRFKSTRDLVRDVMTPSFLQSVSAPRAYDVAVNLVELWRLKHRMAKGHPFQAADDIVEFSFDAILSAATGLGASGGDVWQQLLHLRKFESNATFAADRASVNEPVNLPALGRSVKLKALSTDEESLWKGFYMPWPKLYHRVNKLRPSVRDARRVLRGHINSQITAAVPRLRAGSAPECALDYVIQREVKAADKVGRAPVLDDPRIRDQIYGYLIAGHDTSAGTLAWAVRRLMANPEEQVKIRDNLRETYSDAWREKRLPTAQELVKHAPYLDAFLEEVLRLNCPVVTIMVTTKRDTLILGHHVPEDTIVFLNLTGPSLNRPSVAVPEALRSESSQAHGNVRENWDDMSPSQFMPERWLTRDEDGRLAFNASAGPTLSFSAGNRGCWGKRLGYLELRIVLSVLVWSFNFEEVPEKIVNWDTYDSLVTAPKDCYIRPTDAC